MVVFQYLKEAHNKDGDKLFSRACSNGRRSNGSKPKEGRFRLAIRKMFFWNEGGEALEKVAQRCGVLFLETFKFSLGGL